VYTAHFNAQVVRLEVHCYTVWLQHRIEGIDSLLPWPFLNGEAPGEEVHELRQPGNTLEKLVRPPSCPVRS
jgi:hypothetical protein